MRGDLRGGVFTAVGGIGQSIIYGLMAFSPLGVAGIPYGIHAGLLSGIIGGLMGCLLGQSPVQFGGARSSTALLTAASLGLFITSPEIAAQGPHMALQIALCMMCLQVLMAGVWTITFAKAGIGKLVYFLPAAVLIGLNVTLGALSVAKLISATIGFQVFDGPGALLKHPDGFSVATAIVALGTVSLFVYLRMVRRDQRAAVFSTATGLLLYFSLHALFPDGFSSRGWGPTIHIAPHWLLGSDAPGLLAQVPGILWNRPELLIQLGVGSVVTSLLIILESTTSGLTIDHRLGSRHDSTAELRSVGLSNVLCGLIGASPSSNYITRAAPAVEMGARSRRSEGAYALVLALMLFGIGQYIETLPLGVFACIVAASSGFLIDGNAIRTVKQAFAVPRVATTTATDGTPQVQAERFNGWVVITMLATGAMSNLLIAVVVGVIFTAAYFLQRQSAGGLRSITLAPANRSRRVRPTSDMTALDAAFLGVVFIRFEGSLFFGNAHHIEVELERRCQSMQHIILDFRLVYDVDDTALQTLARCLNRYRQGSHTGVIIMPTQRQASATGLNQQLPPMHRLLHTFAQTMRLSAHHGLDNGLEALEDTLLSITPAQHIAHTDAKAGLAHSDLGVGLSEFELHTLREAMDLRVLAPGQYLFHQGDDGDGLYVLEAGDISIVLESSTAPPVRLLTFSSGVTFGEMALIDQQPRSAAAIAKSPVKLLHLSQAAFERLCAEQPAVSQKLLTNISRFLSMRLRSSNANLSAEQ